MHAHSSFGRDFMRGTLSFIFLVRVPFDYYGYHCHLVACLVVYDIHFSLFTTTQNVTNTFIYFEHNNNKQNKSVYLR